MKLKDTPIQRKLMSVILLTSAAVLFIMCSAYMVFEYYSFRQDLTNNVSTLGAVIASNSTGALAFDSQKDAIEILNALKAEKHIVAAALYNKEGRLFAKYPADIKTYMLPSAPENEDYKFINGFLEGFKPVVQGDKTLGVLYLKSDLETMYSQLRRFALIGLMLIIGSLVIAFQLSQLLQKSISEPILALKETARTISEKSDYSVRAVKNGKDEVGDLTDAFNQMLSQIERQNFEITTFNQKLELTIEERTGALKQQKEFVETIINSSVDIVSVFDKDLNYIMLNKRAIEFYNMNVNEIINHNILEIYPETESSVMYHDLHKALNGDSVHDKRYYSPVLNRFYENFYIPLKDLNEKVYGVLSIGHDISGIVEASEKLEEVNAELVKSNRDLEQFAYVASHDLQEPLRKIQTFTQLMGYDYNDANSIKKYHEKINEAALRMQNLIQDVLNFSRISNSEDAFIKTDLNKIIENLKIDFELLLIERQAVIIHSVLPEINGIPLQLSQLFSNIISNSLKYSEKNPVINISAKIPTAEDVKKYPKLNGNSSFIEIICTDNGIGFEQQFSEQIFDIFQRLHGRQTYSGTGIGLALCKKIVENHNGIIYAFGKPTEGAEFHIILPA